MATLSELLGDLVEDVDGVFLFSPSASFFERFDDQELDVVVVAPENSVGADAFVELPLSFENVKNRIRFGLEGALDRDYVDGGDVVACSVSIFGGDVDGLLRVR